MHLIPLNCTAKNGLKNVLSYIHFATIKKLKTTRGNTSTVDSKLSSLYFNKVSLYHKSISHSIFVNGAKNIPFFFFFFVAIPHGLQNLRTRDGTQTHKNEIAKS